MKIEMLRDVTAQVGYHYQGHHADDVQRTFKKGSVITVEEGTTADKDTAFFLFNEEQTPDAVLQVKLPRDSFTPTLRAFRTTFLFSIDREQLDELPRKPFSLRQVKGYLNDALIADINTEDNGDPLGFSSAEVLISELEEMPAEQVAALYPTSTKNFSRAGVSKKKVVVGRFTPDELKAIAFARNILSSFKDTNLYEDYRDDEEDGFTDEQYDAMFDILDKIK